MLNREKIWLFAVQSSNLTTKSMSILRAAKTNVLQCRDVGNCSDDFIATFRLLYDGTFTRGQISIIIWHFTCKKKWRTLKKSPMAIHIATEAKWGKQIAEIISYVIACKLVASLRTYCFAILSSLWAAKSRIFLFVTLCALGRFEK